MINIQDVSDAYMCSNCGACAAACPKNAIEFNRSSIGRVYANVTEHCINCGMCLKVCPSIDSIGLHTRNVDKIHGVVLSVKIGRAKDDWYYNNSQSGGAVAAILDYLFSSKRIDAAIVCKMQAGNTPLCTGTIITSVAEISSTQKSCYTPVELLSVLRMAKKYRSLAVVGLPCQIQGAVSLSEVLKSFDNIKYKIGLICDRTLCSGLIQVIKSYTKIKGNIKIDWRKKSFVFNDTYYPYKHAPIFVYSNDGQSEVLSNSYRFALKDFFTPPRCRVCYDKMNTFADIVCGDPWGMSNIDWDKGESLVITRTKVGTQILDEMEKDDLIVLRPGNYEEVKNGQYLDRKVLQLSYYSRAAESIPHKILSYLYHQKYVSYTSKMLLSAEREFSDFQRHEMMSECQVVYEARKIIASYDYRMKRDTKIWYKIYRKIKNIIIR